MSILRRFSRFATLGLAGAVLSMSTGCVTCAMWRGLDHDREGRTAAVALTPVTVALDAALLPFEVVAATCDHHGGHHDRCRRRCR